MCIRDRGLVVEQVDLDVTFRGMHDDGSHGLKCLMGLRPAGNPNPVMLRGAGRGTRAGRDPEQMCIRDRPGADLSNEDASGTVIPMQGDEFICSECFLVKHRSQLAYTTDDGQPVCQECAA